MQATLIERIDSVVISLLTRLAPTWYAGQIVRQIPMPEYPALNPLSCNAGDWFDLRSSANEAANQFQGVQALWQPLAKDLSHLVAGKHIKRHVSVQKLIGASGIPGDFSTLPEMAQAQSDLEEYESEEAFDLAVRGFSQSIPVTHREWDGRMYCESSELASALLPVIQHAIRKQRDITIPANFTIEAVKSEPLERIRSRYWWFLMHRDSADALTELFQQCGFPVLQTQGLAGRPDLAWFFAPKQHPRVNKVILELMCHHRSSQLTEFGRYLSTHRRKFRNN